MEPNTNPVNVPASIVGGFIKALMSEGEIAASAYLKVQVPFLALPFFSQVTDYLINLLGDDIQKYVINDATKIVIKVQTSVEQSAIVAAATALQMAQQSGDQDAITIQLANTKKAYSDLGMWDGTYSPFL